MNEKQLPAIEVDLARVGHNCKIRVDGEDVTELVQCLTLVSEVGQPTILTLSCIDINEDGSIYVDQFDAEEKPIDVAKRLVMLEGADIRVRGDAFVLKGDEAVDWLKSRAERLELRSK